MSVASTAHHEQTDSVWRDLRQLLSFRNISAIYIWVAMVILFSVLAPETFPTLDTVRIVLTDQAVTAVLAIGLVIPLAAGAFDLSIGSQLGLGAILVAWLLRTQGLGLVPAIIGTLAIGACVGLANGLLVTKAKISSFITTLGMSSVLLALISWVSQDSQILNLGSGFQQIANRQILSIPMSVYIMVVLAICVWYILDNTYLGRAVYATGGNAEAARLAGIGTDRVIIVSLISCSLLATVAGIVLSSSLATGDPTVGPPYMLPAFAAAFLGSTQFRNGRFNILGTIVAVYVLATGVKGLQLIGAPVWIPELFNGVALLIAVAVTRRRSSRKRARSAETTSLTADQAA
ncbi:MAG: ABC transporter permease [Nocardioides sp.]|nr:ABC transporter permease [Nocardioides sp.]